MPGASFEQSFRYDALQRIKEARETVGGQQDWVQSWEYDRYGNRVSFAQDVAGSTAAPNPAVDPLTNRFAAGQGFGYDRNGNLTSDTDPVGNAPRQFVWSGDNRQTEVKRNGLTVGQYFYDGEGRRVKKVTDLETTVFVYSAGRLIAEYSTATPPSDPKTAYTTTDHLASPRVITDALGQVVSRRDFLPFGEELLPHVGDRSSVAGYAAVDNVRQRFTGYLKDTETSLDFAEARMYENRRAESRSAGRRACHAARAASRGFDRSRVRVKRCCRPRPAPACPPLSAERRRMPSPVLALLICLVSKKNKLLT